MPVTALKQFAETHLGTLLDEPGCVLYSAATTLRPGDLYILGLNPRGSRSDRATTLAEDLDQLPTRTCNAYLDSQWKGYPAGEAPIQKRLAWLVKQLGYDLRNVCASNLIFTSSHGEGDCGYPERADICWPVHERILETVRPRCILAFGNSGVSPYKYLRMKWQPDEPDTRFPAGHGNWQCRYFRAHVPAHVPATLVIGLPHLARYDPTRPEAAEARRRIRELVGTTAIAN